VGPIVAAVGLVLIAAFTLSLLNGNIPFVKIETPGGGNGGNGPDGPTPSPAPPDVVITPPTTVFPGSITYAKAGNIWVQTGKDVKQLTKGGDDSMPSWSPDGSSIYFIRTANGDGQWTAGGVVRDYALTTPSVMQVKADGSADPVRVVSGKVSLNGHTWQSWIREPVVSPDGTTLAMVSDRPNPSVSDVVLQLYDMTSKKSTIPKVAETPPLGHQDPTWRPDGKFLMYVRNGRDGARGAPMIYRYDVAKGKSAAVTGPGYLEPSYSPDGRFVVATKTSSFGNDLVILDAGTGRELLRLTNDGASWSPVWSPIGDAIAFLHLQGQIVDLKMIRLDGDAPNWTVKDITDLTEVSGLDGSSRPGWFVPPDQLPAPTPTPLSSVAPSGNSASPSAQ
jgi:Tol biopolymer transport system component